MKTHQSVLCAIEKEMLCTDIGCVPILNDCALPNFSVLFENGAGTNFRPRPALSHCHGLEGALVHNNPSSFLERDLPIAAGIM